MTLVNLHPQDVVVVLKLIANGSASKQWTYAELSKDLFASTSQIFRSVERAEQARLLSSPAIPPQAAFPGAEPRAFLWPISSNLKEFLIHGVKYVFPVERGGPTRGLPTAVAVSPLDKHFPRDFQLPPVWPHPAGPLQGIAFSPLYKNVPQAALKDPKLYELLALVDAIREGRAREREIAIKELSARIDFATDPSRIDAT
jgi:hypothetical protein